MSQTKIRFNMLVWLFLFIFMLFNEKAYSKEYTEHVVIISIDGLMPKVLLGTNTPKLNNQWKKGSYTFNAQTIFPSYTLPSHTSMLTGVDFIKHQVNWNDYNPMKSITTKNIFDYAKAKKLKTAMYIAKDKFFHFRKNTSPDIFVYPGYEFSKVLAAAESSIISEKPNLSFVHLAEIDGTGHTFGWQSDIQKRMLEGMDTPINNFIKKLLVEFKDLVVIVTSDHGGHFIFHGSNSSDDMTIPWIIRGKIIKENNEIKAKVFTYDTAATALWLLGVEIPKDFDGKPITEVLIKP